MDEDIKVSSFQGVMLALFKTFQMFLADGKDVQGLVDQGLFLSEKAHADVYISDAFVQYDKFTRYLAGLRSCSFQCHV